MPPIDQVPGDSTERMTIHPAPVIACRECDLLQREVALSPGGTARCRRCGALLYRNIRHSLDRTVAFLLAAAVIYLMANIFPIIDVSAQGDRSTSTLLGAVHALLKHDLPVVALLMFITTILAPALEIAAMLYLLLPVRLGYLPPGFAPILRAVQEIKHWNMVEVLLLGLLVSLVRMSRFATVTPDLALWSFGALAFLLAAATASFDPHEIWARAEKARAVETTP
jgi:paraquat-inducible protein A